MSQSKKAVVLLSGGVDSATTLAVAMSDGYACYALSFRYGQRHGIELEAAKKVAQALNVEGHKVFDIDLSIFKGSALIDDDMEVPTNSVEGIPVTYVPARNTIFLSIALAWAEGLHVRDIFIGVNAVDYSGYPDCRPEYIQAYQAMVNVATKAGVEGQKLHIRAPLISLSKADIIRLGSSLGIDYSLTISCYSADKRGRACGVCDSCRFRKQGFMDAGIADPTLYA